jgi:hypothetical protein
VVVVLVPRVVQVKLVLTALAVAVAVAAQTVKVTAAMVAPAS